MGIKYKIIMLFFISIKMLWLIRSYVLRLTNNNCYAADKRRLGVQKTTVGRALGAGTPFVLFSSPTFFCARKNASHFSLIEHKKTSVI
jgi:hypothetical protein